MPGYKEFMETKVIQELKIELNAMRRQRDQAREENKSMSRQLAEFQKIYGSLRSQIEILRGALNEIANMDMTRNDRPTPYHVAICALQTPNPLTQKHVRIQEAMEKVVETARRYCLKSNGHCYFCEALEALDAVKEEKA